MKQTNKRKKGRALTALPLFMWLFPFAFLALAYYAGISI